MNSICENGCMAGAIIFIQSIRLCLFTKLSDAQSSSIHTHTRTENTYIHRQTGMQKYSPLAFFLFFWHINYWRFLTKHDLLRVFLCVCMCVCAWLSVILSGARKCGLRFVSARACVCVCAFVCKRKVFSVCFSFSFPFRFSFLPTAFAKLFTLKIFLRLFRSQLSANAVPDRDGTSTTPPLPLVTPSAYTPLTADVLLLFLQVLLDSFWLNECLSNFVSVCSMCVCMCVCVCSAVYFSCCCSFIAAFSLPSFAVFLFLFLEIPLALFLPCLLKGAACAYATLFALLLALSLFLTHTQTDYTCQQICDSRSNFVSQ